MKLRTQNLGLRLGSRTVLDGITLALEPGRIVGLIGPNGAGKSSLLRALNGVFPEASGSVHLGDADLAALSSAERSRRITYVGAELETDFPLTAAEFVAMGAFALPKRVNADPKPVMEETGCWEFRDRYLAELSSGERQRAHLARALYQGAEWTCLDESFSRLDLHHQARIGKLLKTYVPRGFSFLFVSHDLNFTTDWAEHCILMRDGKILAEGPTAGTVNAENIRKLYPDADVVLTPHPTSGAMKVYFRG